MDRPGRLTLLGMLLLAMSLLILEIGTTRLLSVAMAYHFAVLSISLAMLGLAVGGVIVQLMPDALDRYGSLRSASLAALLFAISTFSALLLLLGLPLQPLPGLAGLMNLALLFLPQSIPYVCAGTAMAILLSRFPRAVSRLYAFDLVGAGSGCIVVAAMIPLLGGPTTIVLAAVLAAASSWALAAGSRPQPSRILHPLPWLVALVVALGAGAAFDLFEIVYVKGYPETESERIVWTAHSRLSFSKEYISGHPFGWGFGSYFVPEGSVYRWRRIQIDGMAETPILRWSDPSDDVRHVLGDVTSLPYLLRSGGRAMVIGSGGGRDIVASQVSGSWQVDAVEINEGIVRAMTSIPYEEYSGSVYRRPGVHAVNLDGRSAIERAIPGSYDLIQMSAVDTWATGASGSLALMENGLYTVQAFRAVIRSLSPDGYFSVSRFKYPQDYYGETVRMVAVAIEALDLEGTRDGSRNLVLVMNGSSDDVYGIATMLVGKAPFGTDQIERVRAVCLEKGFSLVWPLEDDESREHPVAKLLGLPTAADRNTFYESYPIDIRPTWDDRPYFFHQARLSSLRRISEEAVPGAMLRLVPMLTLLRLALFLLVACACLVVLPAYGAARTMQRRVDRGILIYFTALGAGFMLYEIPLVQKLTLGLGHPTHALTVVLFGLLVGTGIGSYLSGFLPELTLRRWHLAFGGIAIVAGGVLAAKTDALVQRMFLLPAPGRIALAGGVVLVIGIVLGTMFPLGVRLVCRRGEEWSIPWCWAANGAAGVLASVLTLILGIEVGLSGAFLTGSAAYAVATSVALVKHRHVPGARV